MLLFLIGFFVGGCLGLTVAVLVMGRANQTTDASDNLAWRERK